MSAYTDFLAAKAQLANSGGFEPPQQAEETA